jgi:hypothetical protein
LGFSVWGFEFIFDIFTGELFWYEYKMHFMKFKTPFILLLLILSCQTREEGKTIIICPKFLDGDYYEYISTREVIDVDKESFLMQSNLIITKISRDADFTQTFSFEYFNRIVNGQKVEDIFKNQANFYLVKKILVNFSSDNMDVELADFNLIRDSIYKEIVKFNNLDSTEKAKEIWEELVDNDYIVENIYPEILLFFYSFNEIDVSKQNCVVKTDSQNSNCSINEDEITIVYEETIAPKTFSNVFKNGIKKRMLSSFDSNNVDLKYKLVTKFKPQTSAFSYLELSKITSAAKKTKTDRTSMMFLKYGSEMSF